MTWAALLIGLIWEDVAAQLAGKAAVMFQRVGRGGLVAFAEDPNYRAYNPSTTLLTRSSRLASRAPFIRRARKCVLILSRTLSSRHGPVSAQTA